MLGIFGTIDNPFNKLGGPAALTGSTQGQGLVAIISSLVKFVIVLAGLYTFWNLIAAGFMFMSAGGDPKAIAKAWDKIWQSLIGLLLVAGSFILAVIFGYLIFGPGNELILIQPRVFSP